MSNLTRSSIKAKAATATFESDKDCVKACLSKAEEIYPDEAKFSLIRETESLREREQS